MPKKKQAKTPANRAPKRESPRNRVVIPGTRVFMPGTS
jgi:hypothetical protein